MTVFAGEREIEHGREVDVRAAREAGRQERAGRSASQRRRTHRAPSSTAAARIPRASARRGRLPDRPRRTPRAGGSPHCCNQCARRFGEASVARESTTLPGRVPASSSSVAASACAAGIPAHTTPDASRARSVCAFSAGEIDLGDEVIAALTHHDLHVLALHDVGDRVKRVGRTLDRRAREDRYLEAPCRHLDESVRLIVDGRNGAVDDARIACLGTGFRPSSGSRLSVAACSSRRANDARGAAEALETPKETDL